MRNKSVGEVSGGCRHGHRGQMICEQPGCQTWASGTGDGCVIHECGGGGKG